MRAAKGCLIIALACLLLLGPQLGVAAAAEEVSVHTSYLPADVDAREPDAAVEGAGQRLIRVVDGKAAGPKSQRIRVVVKNKSGCTFDIYLIGNQENYAGTLRHGEKLRGVFETRAPCMQVKVVSVSCALQATSPCKSTTGLKKVKAKVTKTHLITRWQYHR